MSTAHIINEKQRTEDILADIATDFESLLLSPKVIEGLRHAGFIQPSPIQLQAIPYAKCGVDLICQAKSGTGKTCVFTVCALEIIDVTNPTTQVLVLAPTREIAHQINEVITNIGIMTEGLKCGLFIGGVPVVENIKTLKSCHIATGTPGRVKCLIEQGNLSTEFIRLFVLDEADKLLEEGKGSFQEQINWIYSTLHKDKQVLALSATYPESLANHLSNYMQDPIHVRINIGDLTLKGVKQYVSKTMFHPFPVKAFEEKCVRLLEIIKNLPFQQCMVYSNFQSRAENLSKRLCKEGWPCTFISGSQVQAARVRAMDQLKKYNCRVLITTDLTARGIDCDKVDLVINLDLPWETETYIHRVGRAGRFGSFGVAISIVSEGEEVKKIESISKEVKKEIFHLPVDLKEVWLQNINHNEIVEELLDSLIDKVCKTHKNDESHPISSMIPNDNEHGKDMTKEDANSLATFSVKKKQPVKKLPKYLALSQKMRSKRNESAETKKSSETLKKENVLSSCLNHDKVVRIEQKIPLQQEKSEQNALKESTLTKSFSSCPSNVRSKERPIYFNPMSLNLDLMKISSQDVPLTSSIDHEVIYRSQDRNKVGNHASSFYESPDCQATVQGFLPEKPFFQELSDMIYNEKKQNEFYNPLEVDDSNSDSEYSSFSETSSNLENSTELEILSNDEESSNSDNSWDFENSKYTLLSSEDSGWKSCGFENRTHTKTRTWNHELFQTCFYKAYYNQVSTIQNYWQSCKQYNTNQ